MYGSIGVCMYVCTYLRPYDNMNEMNCWVLYFEISCLRNPCYIYLLFTE